MKIKIHGGTARGSDPPLCLSCRYASIAAGASASAQIIHCSRLDSRIHFPVLSCTRYLHHQHPSLYDLEDIAWILRTDTSRNRIGFVRAKDLKARDRHVLDDDTW
jgi:hypothetical protein